jgi:hypothetical protein
LGMMFCCSSPHSFKQRCAASTANPALTILSPSVF